MTFDPTAPVLGLMIEPGSEIATLRPVAANGSGEIAGLIGGDIEAVEIEGSSVLWLDESLYRARVNEQTPETPGRPSEVARPPQDPSRSPVPAPSR